MYFRIAWRNIWRNKRRTLITIASIFFAVILAIFMRCTINGVFEKMTSDVVGLSSGYIQVHKKGYWDERSIDNTFEEKKQMTSILQNEREVIATSPRLESFALASSGERTKGIMVMGIYPEKEEAITHLSEKISAGKFINDNDNSVEVAEGLAQYLQLKVSDTIVLLGQGYHGSMAAGKYPIKGIIKLGSPELNKSVLWMPMACSRELLGTGERLTSISLLLKNDEHMDEIKQRLVQQTQGEDYEIMTWKEMLPELDQLIQGDKSAHFISVNILYLVITFGIFGTILMMLNERMHEFGILIAIGMKKRILATILLMEIMLMALLGTIFGSVVAYPIALYFNMHPILFTGSLAKAYERFGMAPEMPLSTDISNFTSQANIVFLIALVLSIYPLIRISRLRVIKAINS